MKNIQITLMLLLFTIISNAQSPILDIEEYSFGDSIENAYYKDIHNYFNPFMGTWLYTSPDGLTTFKIVLTKRPMLYTGKYYTDYVTGEYHYADGSLDINTLSNTDAFSRGIWGDTLLNGDSRPLCTDCPINEKRLRLIITDRQRNLSGSFTLRLITVDGQPALETLIYGRGVSVYVESDPPPFFYMRIPTGRFTFIKQ